MVNLPVRELPKDTPIKPLSAKPVTSPSPSEKPRTSDVKPKNNNLKKEVEVPDDFEKLLVRRDSDIESQKSREMKPPTPKPTIPKASPPYPNEKVNDGYEDDEDAEEEESETEVQPAPESYPS